MDLLAVEPGLLDVGDAVERRELLGGELLAHVEHRVEGLAAVVGKAFARAERLDLQPVVQQEVGDPARAHDFQLAWVSACDSRAIVPCAIAQSFSSPPCTA